MRRRPALGLAAGLLAGVALRRLLARNPPPCEPVAHRGGAAEAPENTLAAFRNARDQGLYSWELDVQLTADGALAVFHDETLDRTTDGRGALAGRALADLQRLDAGAHCGARWRGERIPALDEVLALARSVPGGAHLLVEIKSPHLYPGIEQRLLAVLADAHYLEHVLIMSFDGAALARVRALAPRQPLCHLRAEDALRLGRPAADAEVLGLMWQPLALDPLPIVLAHRAGRRVYPWTVNDAAALRWLRLWGVDGIISDRPALLKTI